MRRHPLPAIVAMSLVATLTVGLPATATATAAPLDLTDSPTDVGSIVPLNTPGAEPDSWSDRADALIIRPSSGRSFGQIRARMAELNAGGARIGGTVGDDGARTIHLPADVPVEELDVLAQRLESEGLADHAETDIRMMPFVVNDPGYPDQWHLWGKGGTTHGIDVEAAWTRTTGSTEVTVAVLDSGHRPHPDLDARIVSGYDMITDATNARDGDGRDPDPTDEGDWAAAGDCGNGSPARNSTWHGLHVAGTIGTSTNNAIGVAGVDQRARIQHVRVLGRCGGLGSDVSDGVRWAAGLPVDDVPNNPTPADVINLSLGGPGECGPTIQSSIDAAIAVGSVVIAAAGNADTDASKYAPANCNGVITVAATSPAGDRAGAWTKVDETSVRAPYSNYGGVVDMAAPGGDNTFPGGGVLSTYNFGKTTAGNNGYASMLGTSMAAPHVAGVVSLMLATNAELTPTQARTLLTGTARPFGSSSGAFRCSSSKTAAYHCGAGILDAGSAVSVASGEASAPRLNAGNGDLEVGLSWTASTSLHGPMTYELRRSTGSSCTATSAVIAGPTSSRSHTDTKLKHDTTYRYCVTAVDSNGARSPVSNTRSVMATDLTAPAAPSLSAEAGNEEVSLSWTAVSDPTTPITYRVYRSTSSSCSTSSTLIRTQTGRTYTDTGLKAGTTYRHCVTAADGAGNGSALSNVTSSTTSPAVSPSSPGAICHALVGDWNGSGRSGLGWWCDGRTRLRTAQGSTHDFYYGRRGDIPIVADWNGDGKDTVSVIRDGTWHVNNALEGGASERTFVYGRVTRGDVPIAGSWDRLARSLPGIIRDREWHLRDDQSGGSSTWMFVYGRLTAGDLPLVGDWNADDRDSAGIVRLGEWHLRNSHTGGKSDISYIYGRVKAGDTPVVGDWTGDGMDTPGIVRDGTWHLKDQHGGGPADRTITFTHP